MLADILILGGGPAGTATALALRNHNPSLAVTIVERSAYDTVRIGETLPPQTQLLLDQLGVWPAFCQRAYKPAYGTCAAWGSEALHTNEFIYNVHGRGWHLDRRDFDALLADEAVARGATLYTNTRLVAHDRQANGRWQVTLGHKNGTRLALETAFIVDATGRLAVFASQQGARKVRYDQLVGVFRFFAVDASFTDTLTLVEAWEGGWWYSSLLPNAQMVVACMSDADLVGPHGLKSAGHWSTQVQRTRYTQQRLAQTQAEATSPEGAPGPQIFAAHTQRLETVTGEGWLAVGDAATTFDPLSSQGVFKALRGGIFAAYAFSDHLGGDLQALAKYRTVVKREFAAYRETWQAYYNQEQRWPGSLFWQRRRQARS